MNFGIGSYSPDIAPELRHLSETRSTSTLKFHSRLNPIVTRTIPSTMPTPYERARDQNIQRNKDLLVTLGLDSMKEFVPSKMKEVAPPAKPRKRKSPPHRDIEEGDELEAKIVKTRATQDITNTSGMRRSARNAGKTVDYKSEVVVNLPEVVSTAAKIAMNSGKKAASDRRENPYVNIFSLRRHTAAHGVALRRKQYGHIPGVEVGQWWPTRYVPFTPPNNL